MTVIENERKKPVSGNDAKNIFRSRSMMIALALSLFIIALAVSVSTRHAGAQVTNAKTPAGVMNAHIKWQKQFGTGYANAVTPPLIVGSDIYVGAGGVVYRLNKKDGSIKDRLKVSGVFGYTTIAPAWNGKDRIFVPLSQGRIQCIDISGAGMKAVWTSASFGDQAIVPVVCSDGKLFTGAYGTNNSFVMIDQNTGAVTQLAQNDHKGFYWAGAYVSGKYAVFGEEANADGDSLIRSVGYPSGGSRQNPEVVSQQKVRGSIRSTIVSDGTYLYVVSKSKMMYKMSFDKETGALGAPEHVQLTGEATGVPVVYKGRAYTGTSGGMVDVIDTAAMKRVYSVKVPGYIQGEMLLQDAGGRLSLYGAYNSPVGGLYYISLSSAGATGGDLLIPDHEQYCISPVICDEEGTIYYKNDSGYIMAVAEGYVQKAPKIKAKFVKKKKARKGKVVLTIKAAKNAEGYRIYRSLKKNKKYKKIKTVKRSGSVKITDKKVKIKKTYYYRVKAYKTINGKKVYSTFSNICKLKVK